MKSKRILLQCMTRQSQEKKGRIGLCLCNKKAFEANKWFDGELISGAMCSRFSSIRGSFLEFCWGGCCHWQGRAGSIYWDCQTSQKQKWSPSGDVTTFESFGFCTKASFTIYVGRRWSLRIKIGIKEGIIRLPTISFFIKLHRKCRWWWPGLVKTKLNNF